MEENLLSNKKIIITGGSSGIGKTLAIAFSKMGASIGLIGRSVERLVEVKSQIEQDGGTSFFEIADVQQKDQFEQGVDELVRNLEGIDVMVNCAGMNIAGTYASVGKQFPGAIFPQDLDIAVQELDTNLKGTIFGTNLALKYMIEKNVGSIINTSSIMALPEYAIMESIYCASKGGINLFTKTLANEFKGKGLKITVNVIMPDATDTPMISTLSSYTNIDPPEFLVPFYAFFASDKGAKESGRLVRIDTFKQALEMIKQMPPDQSREWKDLEPLLKGRFDFNQFMNLRENRKLLQFLT
ncbi:MAG TPA: SDR family oxidoreductase [Candidatus Lokiarchaeia archaeon]|nr:SDR family oxidoreductase [Candidatus Lokiarchaeia archaeon]